MPQMNSLIAEKPYLNAKHCIDMSHTTEVMAIFLDFCLFWFLKIGCLAVRNKLIFFGLADPYIEPQAKLCRFEGWRQVYYWEGGYGNEKFFVFLQ